ncbi:MAG: thiamine phosphate synthase [Candidatus Sumerlaeota bacterium]|nr:thiamine phosphate synthase [Candidatus Sumerlaeota bacterium]
MPSLNRSKLRFMLITDRQAARRPIEEVVSAALEAGFTAVQLREKTLPAVELYRLACNLRELTARHDALLIVNDRVDVALAAEADAAQLGWQSLDAPAARKVAQDRLALGVSAHNVVEMRHALRHRADFVLFGPIFRTPSKEGLVEPVGVEMLQAMAIPAPMPVIAVGGIDRTNVGQVVATRAAGVAVIRAVVAADDPFQAARELIAAAEATPRRPAAVKQGRMVG